MTVESQQDRLASKPSTSVADPANGDGTGTEKQPRRACDCCRRRKVRCDSGSPCLPCKKAAIQCTYLQPPRKKGPKTLRSSNVLHVLRRIDNGASGYPPCPLSADRPRGDDNTDWAPAVTSPMSMQYPDPMATLLNTAYGSSASRSTDHRHIPQQTPTTVLRQQHQEYLPQLCMDPLQIEPSHREDFHQNPWISHPKSVPTISDVTRIRLPATSGPAQPRLSGDIFMSYVQLFFDHMFPIMPVIDCRVYLDPSLYAGSSAWSSDTYCFLCAVCAATIVQLDASMLHPAPLFTTKAMDDLFAEECLRERRLFDYIEHASTLSVLTSFFLFAYYGNHEEHAKAWYFLQESITFCENVNLEDEQAYVKLDPIEAQWRRRIYWLLFITERAYAVQRRKPARLHANVALPLIFESEDCNMLSGFVNLANLFATVNDGFVSAWRDSTCQSLCDEIWLANTQKQLDTVALSLDNNVSETQKLDISVTREWLHVLAWQMGVRSGLVWGNGDSRMSLDYPIELAGKIVQITFSASSLALDSHGIGMEQKLSDIGSCLADVLKCTAGDMSAAFREGKQYLNMLLQRLSNMRGKESRYLRPLMSKMDGLIGYELNQTLSMRNQVTVGVRTAVSETLAPAPLISMVDSDSTLETPSMSGNLGVLTHNVSATPEEECHEKGQQTSVQ